MRDEPRNPATTWGYPKVNRFHAKTLNVSIFKREKNLHYVCTLLERNFVRDKKRQSMLGTNNNSSKLWKGGKSSDESRRKRASGKVFLSFSWYFIALPERPSKKCRTFNNLVSQRDYWQRKFEWKSKATSKILCAVLIGKFFLFIMRLKIAENVFSHFCWSKRWAAGSGKANRADLNFHVRTELGLNHLLRNTKSLIFLSTRSFPHGGENYVNNFCLFLKEKQFTGNSRIFTKFSFSSFTCRNECEESCDSSSNSCFYKGDQQFN